jgi:hypothetical protein
VKDLSWNPFGIKKEKGKPRKKSYEEENFL